MQPAEALISKATILMVRAGVFTLRSSMGQILIFPAEHRGLRAGFPQLFEILQLDPVSNSVDSSRMQKLRALLLAMFRPFATAAAVRGGSGHYNEQCHPQT